jgi:hypothetical protein
MAWDPLRKDSEELLPSISGAQDFNKEEHGLSHPMLSFRKGEKHKADHGLLLKGQSARLQDRKGSRGCSPFPMSVPSFILSNRID